MGVRKETGKINNDRHAHKAGVECMDCIQVREPLLRRSRCEALKVMGGGMGVRKAS